MLRSAPSSSWGMGPGSGDLPQTAWHPLGCVHFVLRPENLTLIFVKQLYWLKQWSAFYTVAQSKYIVYSFQRTFQSLVTPTKDVMFFSTTTEKLLAPFFFLRTSVQGCSIGQERAHYDLEHVWITGWIHKIIFNFAEWVGFSSWERLLSLPALLILVMIFRQSLMWSAALVFSWIGFVWIMTLIEFTIDCCIMLY